MNLLTFAHRGEAQHFLKNDDYKPLEFEFKGLYKNERNYLLITGEGLQSTEERMSALLSQPNLTIYKVINLGIAGTFDENLKLESVHSVKLIKKEDESETFQSSDVYADIICISAFNRVLNVEYKNNLAKRAQIVDRELWAYAKVCNKYQIPIYSFKLISDYAGDTTDFHQIIQKSKEHSKKLYDYYNEAMTKQDI